MELKTAAFHFGATYWPINFTAWQQARERAKCLTWQ